MKYCCFISSQAFTSIFKFRTRFGRKRGSSYWALPDPLRKFPQRHFEPETTYLPHEKLRAPIIPWPSSQGHNSLIRSSVRFSQTFFCYPNASILAYLSRKSLTRNPSPTMASQAPADTYTLPTSLHNTTSGPGRKTWRHRLDLLTSRTGSQGERSDNEFRQTNTNASARSRHVPKWWKIRLFRGMIRDVRRRAPFYWSDWTDAWDYRVVPATIYMYFAKYVLFPSCSYKSEERN
jgi:hypothetical protein